MTPIPDDEAYYKPKNTQQTHCVVQEIRIVNKTFGRIQKMAKDQSISVEELLSNIIMDSIFPDTSITGSIKVNFSDETLKRINRISIDEDKTITEVIQGLAISALDMED